MQSTIKCHCLPCLPWMSSTRCMSHDLLDVQHMLKAPLACSAQGACSHDLLHVQHKVHAHMISWMFSMRYMLACSHDLLDVQHKAHACMTSWMFSTYSKKLLDVQHILKKTLGCSAQGASHDFLDVKHKVHACMFTWTLGCSAQGTCSHDLLDGQHKVYAHMTSWVSSTRYMLISQKEKH